MTIFEAIILGIIQGITEFLPISSSGHLVLLGKIWNIGGDFIFFSVTLHFATLLAVCLYFKKEVWYLIKHPFCETAKKLYIATIPTVILVLIFESRIQEFFSGIILPFCFMFTAVLLIVTQLVSVKSKTLPIDKKGSFWMGVAQGIATIPGISRSGSTICTGVIMGYDRTESAKFSFLMSIPIIFASFLYELLKLFKNGGGFFYPAQTIIASIFAFFAGLLAIKLMLWIVKKIKFYYFAVYLILISIISFLFLS